MGLLFAEPIVIVDPGPIGGAPVGGAPGAASFAPNTPAGRWAAASLPVPFVLALPRSRDVGAEAAAELEVALRTWPRAKCTSFRTRFDGEKTAVAADDGVNVVLFHDDAWPAELVPGAVAQTVVYADGSGNYRDADIHINSKEFRFSLDGKAGTLDLRSVLVHELGHALGLGHSNDPRATMFASGNGVRWRSLEKDDVDGVCSLYAGTGAAGCEAAPCPSPFLCVASACQRPKDAKDVCAPCERVADACEAAGDGARCIDIVAGGSPGRVCGRACALDADCGAGFRCKPTTEAGDLQCVSETGCANGASLCAKDADCTNAVCRGGACVGVVEGGEAGVDGGGDGGSGADAGIAPGPPIEPACLCTSVGGGDGGARDASHKRGGRGVAFLVAVVALVARLRSRSAGKPNA